MMLPVTVERLPGLSSDVGSAEGAGIDDPPAAEVDAKPAADESARLRQVLVARYGWELGLEAWHDAMAYAWEHQAELGAMANQLGYLYRVAQSSVRRQRRWRRRVVLPPVAPDRLPDVEPRLPAALEGLSSQQRLAVLLVHAHGWTHAEAAAALAIEESTLRNHLRRGLRKLRSTLGADDAESH
jgi:DNA-directed RNA polymerase specialized sigma24 family protein